MADKREGQISHAAVNVGGMAEKQPATQASENANLTLVHRKTQNEQKLNEEIQLVRALSIGSATDVEDFFKSSEVELRGPCGDI